MDTDLSKLLEGSDEYTFNPARLDAVPPDGRFAEVIRAGKVCSAGVE